MRSQIILDEYTGKTYVLVFDTGDEVLTELLRFAVEANLTDARFSAIGAFRDVILGYFDPEQKQYLRNPVREQVEVLSLLGNVATHEGRPQVHAHVVVGKRDGTAHGGHLVEAHVRPTLEVMLTESPRHLQRRYDPETGLALIRL